MPAGIGGPCRCRHRGVNHYRSRRHSVVIPGISIIIYIVILHYVPPPPPVYNNGSAAERRWEGVGVRWLEEVACALSARRTHGQPGSGRIACMVAAAAGAGVAREKARRWWRQ